MAPRANLVIFACLACPVACKLPGRAHAVLQELQALDRALSDHSQLERRLRSDLLYAGWLRKMKNDNADYDKRFVTLTYDLLDMQTQGMGVRLKWYTTSPGPSDDPNGEMLHLERYVNEDNPRIVDSSTPGERGGVSMCINVPERMYTSKSTQQGFFSANPMSADQSTGAQDAINNMKTYIQEEITGEMMHYDEGKSPVNSMPRTFCFQPPAASAKMLEFNYYAPKNGQPRWGGFAFDRHDDVTEETHREYLARWKSEIVEAVRTFKEAQLQGGVAAAEALVQRKRDQRRASAQTHRP